MRSTFDAPQSAVTPGQAVVFYDGDGSSAGVDRLRTDGESRQSGFEKFDVNRLTRD